MKMNDKQKEAYAKHIDLLGYKGTDKVTGTVGVIESISFGLYGCICATIRPKSKDASEMADGYCVDVRRLKLTTGLSSSRAMPLPDFHKGYIAEGKKGAADRSTIKKG